MDSLNPPVDREARESLFCLAQVNYEGANAIIAKMIKKVAEQKWMINPSGFIHSSVLNERARMSPHAF